jgi:predicted nucleotidyltransferase
MDRAAFLSVRLPPEVRNRIQTAAAARGKTVQDLIGGLVADFLAEQDRKPASLPVILTRLRGHEADLRRRSIAGLWVFGSVARGDAQPDSDIDLVADLDPPARVSVTGLASLRADLADLLGGPVDLAEWGHPQPAGPRPCPAQSSPGLLIRDLPPKAGKGPRGRTWSGSGAESSRHGRHDRHPAAGLQGWRRADTLPVRSTDRIGECLGL